MNKLRNESGIALVELLASLVIGTIIIIMVTIVFVTFHKQYNSQSDVVRDITNVSKAAQTITKNIRSAIAVKINETNDSISIIQPDQTITYTLVDDNLEKDNVIYLRKIKHFYVNKNDH